MSAAKLKECRIEFIIIIIIIIIVTSDHRLFKDRVLVRIDKSPLCPINGYTKKEFMCNTIPFVTLSEKGYALYFISRCQAHSISRAQ